MNAGKLRGKLAEKNISGKRLAILLDVSSNTVYRWLKTGRIKSNYIKDIKAVLDLTAAETEEIFLS